MINSGLNLSQIAFFLKIMLDKILLLYEMSQNSFSMVSSSGGSIKLIKEEGVILFRMRDRYGWHCEWRSVGRVQRPTDFGSKQTGGWRGPGGPTGRGATISANITSDFGASAARGENRRARCGVATGASLSSSTVMKYGSWRYCWGGENVGDLWS